VPEADSGNAIAVVVVSSVAFICLVLLAGLLVSTSASFSLLRVRAYSTELEISIRLVTNVDTYT
jgi:hypothetical protein